MDSSSEIPLLIIGAGPFGLALSSFARSHGVGCLVVGEPMAFWKHNMPKGMLLRSTCGWSLDPADIDTIDAFLATSGRVCAQVEPLSLEFYLRYAEWFQDRKQLEPRPAFVRRLDRDAEGFSATFEDNQVVRAHTVVVAVGLRYFANSPADITSVLPPGSFAHTCEYVDLARLAGRRVLIIGGRQSAFEWAALLHEAKASAVHLSYRHDTPVFKESDWTWVPALVERIRSDGGWYRRLPEDEKQAIVKRMWLEGRAKLEPWLVPRLAHSSIQLWPNTRVSICTRAEDGELNVTLDSGAVIAVDQIILATGYKVDIRRIPFLEGSNLWDGLVTRDGSPVLDEWFESSHPGLFFTGQAAAQDFGPFFGFTVSARASAQRIGQAILRRNAVTL